MNNLKFQFKYYNGQQIKDEKPELLNQMKNVFKSRDCKKENVLEFLDEESIVCCMFKDEECVGFAWLAFCHQQHLSELCWFATNKNKLNGIEAKLLLDEVFDYCKSQDVKSVKFNCFDESWNRIKNKDELFKKFGYNLSQDESYDMSIEL